MPTENNLQTNLDFDKSLLPDMLSYLIFSKFDECSTSVLSIERNGIVEQALFLNSGALFRSLNERVGGLALDRITFAHSRSKDKGFFDEETRVVDSMDMVTRQWLRHYQVEDDSMNPKTAGKIIGPIKKFVVMTKIARAEPWAEHNNSPAH